MTTGRGGERLSRSISAEDLFHSTTPLGSSLYAVRKREERETDPTSRFLYMTSSSKRQHTDRLQRDISATNIDRYITDRPMQMDCLMAVER